MNWLCIPGWGTCPEIFEDIMPEQANFTSVDLNFFNNKQFPTINLSGIDGVVCYSLGSLLCLRSIENSEIKKVVFIGGFLNFPGNDSKDSKRRKLKINLMIRGLKKDPKKTLKDFTQEAELKFTEKSIFNTNNLIHGLELLRDCDMSHAIFNTEAEIYSIHGKEDLIIPLELKNMQFTNIEKESYTLAGNHGIIETQSIEIKKILTEIM